MNIHQKQLLFGYLFNDFLSQLHAMGYEHKNGEYKRTPYQASRNAKLSVGVRNSLHLLLLAADIELYKDGKWLRDCEDYKGAAELWESMHELCSAGYYFQDGNHFSITHNGVR